MASRVKQDMPPKGGYGPITWEKTIMKPRWGGYTSFALFTGITVAGWAMYHIQKKWKMAVHLEMNDARIALEPFMLAERHRMYLKHLRKNRDEERELMKDVEGWEVGHYKGEPVYWNQANRFHYVCPEEYYMHNEWSDMYNRLYEKLDH